ncbi:MAG: hypothetical protein K0R53_1722 [Burkholderiales bacterium]|nr:hypothetical protein [Burkholderiales bacterium]
MPLTRNGFLIACLLCPLTTLSADPNKIALGVELGTRFRVPPCEAKEVSISSRLCFNSELINRKVWGADEYYVSIPSAGTPPYVRGELRVSVVGSIVESIQIGTWGIQAQGAALEALTRKYGKPARARTQKLNALRSRFPTQYAEWDLEDFSVKLDGTTGSVDWGRIELTTYRYQKRVKDYEATAASLPKQ